MNSPSSFRLFQKSPALEAGFTMLEVLIALGIMMVSFAAILGVQSNSINTTDRSKRLTTVAMLAKNQMLDTESMLEGKSFKEVSKEDEGTFEEPHQEFSWKREIKEIKFPNLLPAGQSGDSDSTETERFGKLLAKFLSDSIREVTITIKFKRGNQEQSYKLSTYWVDFNRDFTL